MPIFRIFAIVILLLVSTAVSAEEIVARAKTWAGVVSLMRDGENWDDSCSLILSANFQQVTHQVQLRRPGTYCALFGPVHIILSESQYHDTCLIFMEASRGGDGDHTGPLIEVFRLNKEELKKIGELELYSATYLRKAQEIRFIEGELLFSFFPGSPRTSYGNSVDDIYVPVRVRVDRTGITAKSIATLAERRAIWNRFNKRKASAQQDFGKDVDIASLEQQLRSALRMK